MEVLEESIFPEKLIVYATFWTRFAAALIDTLILLIPNLILRALPGGGVLIIIMYWLYFALQESGPKMATLGKKAMHIKVTDLSNNRITFGQATGRYFGKIISFLILFIGYFMMLWDERKQTLHDKMANTLVVQE